ncbi:MAG TPA: hypothetical protein VMC07_00830, partial [Candidatus Omnitrophota bacterium]|nr:hypothetical protein [Candidatus Omnitrophota bacterium]
MKKKRNNSGKVRIREIKKPKVREIKNKEPEVKKEESLEQHVEDSEIFESNELPEFVSSSALPSSQSTAPVLEKIQREEEADLESNVISTPLSREITQEGVATNYGASQNYFSSGYNEVNGN